MKTFQRVLVNPQGGMDLSIPADPATAQLIENFTFDPQTKGWTTHLGYEPFFHSSATNGPFDAAVSLDAPVDSLYVFQKHSSKQQNILFECNGRLCELRPWRNTSTVQMIILDANRTLPTPNGVRTSYEPFGRYCIITNGIDNPVKYRADGRLYPLGWAEIPGDPTVSGVIAPDAAGTTRALEASDDYIGSNVNIYQGDDSYFEGITSDDASVQVEYLYRVSFVNENGSESPQSNDSNKFVYQGVSISRDGNTGVPKVCTNIEIPKGPLGTVARRIYRTQSDGNRSLFYFVEEIKNNTDVNYVDYRSDLSLGAQAPNRSSSIAFPAQSTRFCASFKNCLFVDGGEMSPTRLYYSNPLEPDTFSALSYFEVGTREGGDITGLAAYYNSLLVFRENGIDLIRGDAVNGFELVPFIEGIGSYSHNAIVAIPNLGVCFVSRDGVYLLAGGLDGGSDLKLSKLSQGLDEVFERLSIDAMTAVVAAYSAKEKELQFYLPMSGVPDLTIGLVFHTDRGVWTQRNDFPVRCLTTDKDGNFLFGCSQYLPASGSAAADAVIRRGIYVISAKRTSGTVGTATDAPKDAPPMDWTFRSQWQDMGIPYLKKYPKFLYLYVMTTGDEAIKVASYKDRDWQTPYDSGDVIMQIADDVDQPVYDKALWDKVKWQDRRLVQVRVAITGGAYSEYAFEITGTQNLALIGYSIEYQTDGAMTIRGK
jgi:hypothetical protein